MQHVIALKRTNSKTVARLQAALDREFCKRVCTITRDKTGILLEIPATEEARRPYLVAFTSGFLAARSA